MCGSYVGVCDGSYSACVSRNLNNHVHIHLQLFQLKRSAERVPACGNGFPPGCLGPWCGVHGWDMQIGGAQSCASMASCGGSVMRLGIGQGWTNMGALTMSVNMCGL